MEMMNFVALLIISFISSIIGTVMGMAMLIIQRINNKWLKRILVPIIVIIAIKLLLSVTIIK